MITTVIPVYELEKAGRDLERVALAVQTLRDQDKKHPIIIVDGSKLCSYTRLNKILQPLDVIHIHRMQEQMNLPKLLNEGLRLVTTPYAFVSGADMIYGKGFLEKAKTKLHDNHLLIFAVRMLPKGWLRPEGRHAVNPYGKLANGCQLLSMNSWRKLGGFEEGMAGHCGFDNDLVNRAKKLGLRELWVKDQVYHLHHPESKGKVNSTPAQMQKNWNIRDSKRPVNVGYL